ncbi:MAG: exopolysaccharide biosynthesis protein [Chthoniobacterales bacterium]|nr:exopolysaccharide biosynthesis protein [Chthoniobacterales bacterium]
MLPTPVDQERDPFRPRRLSVELQILSDSAEHSDLTMGDLVDRLEGRVYTLLLVILALPFCQPIMLPGLSTPFGMVIALLGLRFALRQHPWLPQRLLKTHLSGKYLPKILHGSARVLGGIEKLLHPRLLFLFDYRLTQFLAGMAVFFSGLMLLLPLPIPFSNMLPSLTVVLVASSFSERDGATLGAGLILFLISLGFIGAIFFGGSEAITWICNGFSHR